MLTDTFISKTFVDDLGLFITAMELGQFTSLKFPAISGKIRFNEENQELEVMFDSEILQKEFECMREERGLKKVINSRKVLSSYSEGVRELIEKYGEKITKEKEEEDQFNDELEDTEAIREAKERLGQQKYRSRLEKLWGKACAVTGLSIAPVLRASHAKPWAECLSGQERLDPYNGFLLVANLDALFDKFLISFDDGGKMLVAPNISKKEQELLGIREGMRLRKVHCRHLPYLKYHREKFETNMKSLCR